MEGSASAAPPTSAHDASAGLRWTAAALLGASGLAGVVGLFFEYYAGDGTLGSDPSDLAFNLVNIAAVLVAAVLIATSHLSAGAGLAVGAVPLIVSNFLTDIHEVGSGEEEAAVGFWIEVPAGALAMVGAAVGALGVWRSGGFVAATSRLRQVPMPHVVAGAAVTIAALAALDAWFRFRDTLRGGFTFGDSAETVRVFECCSVSDYFRNSDGAAAIETIVLAALTMMSVFVALRATEQDSVRLGVLGGVSLAWTGRVLASFVDFAEEHDFSARLSEEARAAGGFTEVEPTTAMYVAGSAALVSLASVAWSLFARASERRTVLPSEAPPAVAPVPAAPETTPGAASRPPTAEQAAAPPTPPPMGQGVEGARQVGRGLRPVWIVVAVFGAVGFVRGLAMDELFLDAVFRGAGYAAMAAVIVWVLAAIGRRSSPRR